MFPGDACAREHLRRPHSRHVHSNPSMRQHTALRPSWHLRLYETGRREDLTLALPRGYRKTRPCRNSPTWWKSSVDRLGEKLPPPCVIAGDYNGVVELSLSRQGSGCDGWCDGTPARPFALGLPEDHASLPCTANFAVASGCLIITSVCSPLP
jgi:hypothetical protein